MKAVKAPRYEFGPDKVTRYNVNDDQEWKAWEDAWAAYLGQGTFEDIPSRGNNNGGGNGSNEPTPESIERKKRFAEAAEYIAAYRGTFGLVLDLRADPRFGSKHFTMTDRQIDAVLASKEREARWAEEAKAKNPRMQEALDYLDAYTGDFDFLNDLKARGQSTLSDRQVDAVLRCRDKENARQRPTQNGSGGVTQVTQDGFYKHGEDIVKVQVAVHGSGNLYAKRLIVHGQGQASWEYAPGLVTQLTEDERLTLEQAQEFGRLYGVCGICGATLTDERSIANGIGPICAGRL